MTSISQLSLKTLAGNRRIQQAGFLYLSKVLGVVFAFVTSVIYTRTLGPNGYGDLKFINVLFEFLATISTLGLFITAGQMIAQMPHDSERKSEFVGGVVFVAGIISCVLVLITVVFCAIGSGILSSGIRKAIAIFSPTIPVIIFDACFSSLLQGDNRIHEMASSALMRCLLLVIALAVVQMVVPLNLMLTLGIQMATGLLVSVFLMARLHPRMSNLSLNVRILWKENRQFGRHVYVGILCGLATGYISTFTISYFMDNSKVGFYSLALALSFPLSGIPEVVGTTYFKDFSSSSELPKRATLVALAISLGALVLFLIVIEPLVNIVYTEKFAEVVSLTRILAFGTVMEGFGTYINRFLMAHGRGQDLRNVAIVVGCVNVAGFTILVKLLGVAGAAITYVFSRATHLGLFVLYYKRFYEKGLSSK